MTAAVIAACAGILTAVLSYILGQRAQIRQERRQARLARVSSQVRELYGPLNAMVDVNERIWQKLRDSGLPPQAERQPEAGTENWRRWRDGALMPANRRMCDLIVENADLLVETEVPQPLRDFCAHVTSAEIVLAAEAEGTRERALIPHPGSAYVQYVRETFAALKLEQQQLLRTMASQVKNIEQGKEHRPPPEVQALLTRAGPQLARESRPPRLRSRAGLAQQPTLPQHQPVHRSTVRT